MKQCKNCKKALEALERFGGFDGSHHKQYALDQMARTLTGNNYEKWVADMREGEDGPDTYEWDEGIIP